MEDLSSRIDTLILALEEVQPRSKDEELRVLVSLVARIVDAEELSEMQRGK